MNITYNNITIPFYGKHILDLIEKSPYKERCNKELKLDKDGIPKTIVVSLSGGCDSASALYLTAKHFPNIEIYPITFQDVRCEWDALAAEQIVKFIQKRFPNAKLNDIFIDKYDDLDQATYPKAQDMIDNDPRYQSCNLTQMSKINQLDEGNERFMKQWPGCIRLDGMTDNPPKETRLSFAESMKKAHPNLNFREREILRVQGELRRDNPNKPELTYNVYQPFVNVNKKFVADIFKQEGLLEELYPITRSCVGGANQTNNFKEWCWQCFWCFEKAWAFDQPFKCG